MTTMGMRLTDEDVEEMIEEADNEGTGQVGVKQARKVWRCDSYLQIWNYKWPTDPLTDNKGTGQVGVKNPQRLLYDTVLWKQQQ